jgi:basic amino acid/polyamine antiporter, APA family
MRNNVLRRLPVERAIGQSYGGGRHRLGITFKTRDLVVLGLGAMIGAGIFSISAYRQRQWPGPR